VELLTPQGFIVNGLNCGIKDKKDIGFILSDRVCNIAGVTTTSTTAAACVHYNRKILNSGQGRLLVVNSGNANAFTGEQGMKDVNSTVEKAGEEFQVDQEDILVASTGIIGRRLPMDNISRGLEQLSSLKQSDLLSFSEAIRTTDLTDKIISKQVNYQDKEVVLTGIAKGSGMIHPQMATMLAFIITDIEIDSKALNSLVAELNEETFNMISVDGDTSTNDMVLVMGNGAAGVSYQDIAEQFNTALKEVFVYLAKEIARDGEGATKLIEVVVSGARDMQEARSAARRISASPLIKTAIYGQSQNIGRLVAAIGAAQVSVDMERLEVCWQGIDTAEVLVKVDLGVGASTARAWGCDLTERYIEINTDYN